MHNKVISLDVKLFSYLPLLVNSIFYQNVQLFAIPSDFNILSACITIFISKGILICLYLLTCIIRQLYVLSVSCQHLTGSSAPFCSPTPTPQRHHVLCPFLHIFLAYPSDVDYCNKQTVAFLMASICFSSLVIVGTSCAYLPPLFCCEAISQYLLSLPLLCYSCCTLRAHNTFYTEALIQKWHT